MQIVNRPPKSIMPEHRALELQEKLSFADSKRSNNQLLYWALNAMNTNCVTQFTSMTKKTSHIDLRIIMILGQDKGHCLAGMTTCLFSKNSASSIMRP